MAQAPNEGVSRLAQCGWVLVGLYFFNDSLYYFELEDLVLTIMTALALPIAVALVIAEARSLTERDRAALNWARGCVAYAGGPYLLVAHIPWLSVLAIWFVATQVAMFLSFTGTVDIKLGETYVNTDEGRFLWDDWDGNKWFMTDGFAEHPFQTELIMADGGFIGINFVLACTALQSMIVFIGAISVLMLIASVGFVLFCSQFQLSTFSTCSEMQAWFGCIFPTKAGNTLA